MNELERYARWLSSYFYVPGMDKQDLRQEARLAMWLARPGCERIAARRRILDLLKMSQRRPQFVELVEAETTGELADLVDGESVCVRSSARTSPGTSGQPSAGSCAVSRSSARRRRSRPRSSGCDASSRRSYSR